MKDRLQQNLNHKRNIDIVDNIYDKAERRTMNHIGKLVYIDHKGLKHRVKEKSLAEENLEKIEKVVSDEFVQSRDFMKH